VVLRPRGLANTDRVMRNSDLMFVG